MNPMKTINNLVSPPAVAAPCPLPSDRARRTALAHFLRLTGLAAVLIVVLTAVAAAAATPKDVYRRAGPAVVVIRASESPTKGNIGTGSIIRSDGLILTNAHLIEKAGGRGRIAEVHVFLKPHEVTGNRRKDLSEGYRARILAIDPALDLALLQIQVPDDRLPVLEIADSEPVSIGDPVYAIGHPEQGGLWSLTAGVISAVRRDFGGIEGKDLFQTDAGINRGHSGGPLLDGRGRMVGVNSMIARKAVDGMTITDVNYAIMANVARNWLRVQGHPIGSRQAADAFEDQHPATPTEVPPSRPRSKEAPPDERTSDGTDTPPESLPQRVEGIREMEALMEEMRRNVRSKEN